MTSFRSTTAKIVSGSIIGLIIIAFLFTFDSPRTFVGSGDLGKVGPHKIKFQDYNQEYNFQLKMLSLQTGGESLTNEQIEKFGIRHRALQKVIEKKLYLILAEKSGIIPGPTSLREEIKKQDSFQTEGLFDFVKYKNWLQDRRLTPSDFEKLMADDWIVRQSQQLFSRAPIAQNFAKEVFEMKKLKREVSAIQIKNTDLVNFISVSPSEIDDYLATDAGKKEVQKLFLQRKSSFERPEQVKARHILFKGKDSLKKAKKIHSQIRPKNFETLAKKHSEGPTQKKGGDLGWFGRGRMVEEFDKVAFSLKKGQISKPVKTTFGHHLIYIEDRKDLVPAKVENHQHPLASELLRQNKTEKADKLRKEITQKFRKKTSKKNWEKIAKKYALRVEFNKVIDPLNPRIGIIELSPESRKKIFSGPQKNLFSDESKTASTIIRVLGLKKEKDKKNQKTMEQEWDEQKRSLSYELKRKLMGQLWENTPITCRGMTLKTQQDVFKCQI